MELLDNKTHDELKQLLMLKNEEYETIKNECIKKNLTWDRAIEVIRPIATDIFAINEQIRLVSEPTLTNWKQENGKLYTMNGFMKLAKSGRISDSNGYGVYAASEHTTSDIPIYVADIINNKYRKDFNFVLWQNK